MRPITDFCFQQACFDKLREQTADHPELQDFDEDVSASASISDPTSRPMSSMGTPQPAKSGIKLKLNGSRSAGVHSRQGTDSLAQSDEE